MIHGHGSDEAAVRAVVSVISHDEDRTFRHCIGAVHREFHRFIDVWFFQLLAIAPYMAYLECQRDTTLADDALHPDVVLTARAIKDGAVVLHRFFQIIHP